MTSKQLANIVSTRARATAGTVAPKAKVPRGPMHLYLPYPPSLNRLWRSVNGRNILSREGRAYRERVASSFPVASEPFAGPVKLTVKLYRPRKSGDLDNFLKALLDSIKGVAYHDDSQVVQIHAYRSDVAGVFPAGVGGVTVSVETAEGGEHATA